MTTTEILSVLIFGLACIAVAQHYTIKYYRHRAEYLDKSRDEQFEYIRKLEQEIDDMIDANAGK